ncbi:MAG TPA: radical SAM protein, partial [Polyangium sp.]|nr:radical SAM protein [Polyangium sp.]
MRVARVLTNETCNQACSFCTARRPAERREFIVVGAVKQRIHRALTDGAREIVFTGGEPTMRRDLAELVRYARVQGAERVVV